MKKVSKIFLKDNVEVLEKDEMKLILGGSYVCCCAYDSNICTGSGSSMEDARNALSYICADAWIGNCYVKN